MTCGGCLKARRRLINVAPARIAAPIARAVLPTVTDAAAVVAQARTWVGVPFRHQGRARTGVDCWGFPVMVLRALGALPDGFDRADYPRHPHGDEIERTLSRYCTKLPAPVPGALIAVRWSRQVAHVAVLTDTDTLIHCYERAPGGGAVIEHGFRGMWRGRLYAGAWALPGVRYG